MPVPLPVLVYALGGVAVILLGIFVYLLMTGESVYLESHWGGLGGGLGGWRVSRALSALLGAIAFASLCVLLAVVLQQSELEQKRQSAPSNPARTAQP
jgi:hypothetical protein